LPQADWRGNMSQIHRDYLTAIALVAATMVILVAPLFFILP